MVLKLEENVALRLVSADVLRVLSRIPSPGSGASNNSAQFRDFFSPQLVLCGFFTFSDFQGIPFRVLQSFNSDPKFRSIL